MSKIGPVSHIGSGGNREVCSNLGLVLEDLRYNESSVFKGQVNLQFAAEGVCAFPGVIGDGAEVVGGGQVATAAATRGTRSSPSRRSPTAPHSAIIMFMLLHFCIARHKHQKTRRCTTGDKNRYPWSSKQKILVPIYS